MTPVELQSRIQDLQDAGLPWLVAEDSEGITGYAYAGPWNSRCAYRHSVEVSVYLRVDATGSGIGTALYRALFDRLEAAGTHVVIAGIALPNEASVALHERFGMRQVAHFEEVGFKFGSWIDVGYWQLPPGAKVPD